MNPSQFAATTILPFLARIVLALAFLPQGWNNLMVLNEFTGTDAQRLRELGVRGVTDPEPTPPDVSLGAVRGEWQSTSPVEPEVRETPRGSEPAPRTAPAPRGTDPGNRTATRQADAPARTTPRPAETAAPKPLDPPRPEQMSPLAPLKANGLYRLALYADSARLPFPVALAWAVSAIQLIGGGCVVLGIFCRVWGLLMAVILAGVFVTGTLPNVKGVWFFGMSGADFNLVFAQMGLFVLALGVFLVGPGALSLDRAIFRRSRAPRRAPTRTA